MTRTQQLSAASAQTLPSDLLLLVSWVVVLDVRTAGCVGILERLRFSLLLSPSLSDVRCVSLFAFSNFTPFLLRFGGFSPAGTYVNRGNDEQVKDGFMTSHVNIQDSNDGRSNVQHLLMDLSHPGFF